jgi:hypothetical protein
LEDDLQTSVASNNKTLRRVFISACEQDAPNLNIGEAVSWDGSVVTLAKSDSLPLEVRAAIAEVKALFAAEPPTGLQHAA